MIKVRVKEDLTNKKFNRLTVIERSNDIERKGCKPIPTWKCKCDCGNEVVVRGCDLKSGHTKSCGCLNIDKIKERNILSRKLNKYEEYDDYYLGIATNGIEFKIDKEDFEKIISHTWQVNKKGYIYTQYMGKKVFIHRIVMNIHGEDWINQRVDHINHDVTDNRKANLRIVTPSQNTMNSKVRCESGTQIKGIYKRKDCDRYEVNIQKNGKQYYLGLYKTLDEAIKARKEAEEKMFGEYKYKSA